MNPKKTLVFFVLLFSFGMVSGQLPPVRCSDFGRTLFEEILGLRALECPPKRLREKAALAQKKSPPGPGTLRYTDVSQKTKFPCPAPADVVLVAGQSNSANHLLSHSYPPNSNTFNYYQGGCFDLSNPTLGATGNRDSLVPALASKLNPEKPVIFVTTGRGGTSILDWSNEKKTGLADYTHSELASLEREGNRVRAVIWIQGEADAHTGIEYEPYFLKTRDRITKNLSAPGQIKFLITETSQCFRRAPDPSLTLQQHRLGEKYDFVEVVANTDALGREYRHDDCHFNEAGTELLSTQLAGALARTLAGPTDP